VPPSCAFEGCDQDPIYCQGHFEAEVSISTKLNDQLQKTLQHLRTVVSRIETAGLKPPPEVTDWLKEHGGYSPSMLPLFEAHPVGTSSQRPSLRYSRATLSMIFDMYWEMSGNDAVSVNRSEIFRWFYVHGWHWRA
jgi:hypothetical protein